MEIHGAISPTKTVSGNSSAVPIRYMDTEEMNKAIDKAVSEKTEAVIAEETQKAVEVIAQESEMIVSAATDKALEEIKEKSEKQVADITALVETQISEIAESESEKALTEITSYKNEAIEDLRVSADESKTQITGELNMIAAEVKENAVTEIQEKAENAISDLQIAAENSISDLQTATASAIADAKSAIDEQVAEFGIPKCITESKITISAAEWDVSEKYAKYPFEATLTIPGITSEYYVDVAFSLDDILRGTLAPVSESGNGTVTIYSSEIPTYDVVIESIFCVAGGGV